MNFEKPQKQGNSFIKQEFKYLLSIKNQSINVCMYVFMMSSNLNALPAIKLHSTTTTITKNKKFLIFLSIKCEKKQNKKIKQNELKLVAVCLKC